MSKKYMCDYLYQQTLPFCLIAFKEMYWKLLSLFPPTPTLSHSSLLYPPAKDTTVLRLHIRPAFLSVWQVMWATLPKSNLPMAPPGAQPPAREKPSPSKNSHRRGCNQPSHRPSQKHEIRTTSYYRSNVIPTVSLNYFLLTKADLIKPKKLHI